MTKCPHDPKQLLGEPIGMYHCPDCGEMVVAGIEHPDMAEAMRKYDEYIELQMQAMMLWLHDRLNLNDFSNITQSMRNTLIEIWLRADINEDHICGFCSKKVPERYLYCNATCEAADEIQIYANTWP